MWDDSDKWLRTPTNTYTHALDADARRQRFHESGFFIYSYCICVFSSADAVGELSRMRSHDKLLFVNCNCVAIVVPTKADSSVPRCKQTNEEIILNWF